MRFILLVLVAGFNFSTQAENSSFQGFIELGGRSLYVDMKESGPGKPTVVLANGLTYSTAEWDGFVSALMGLDSQVGVFRWDMNGMGNSLKYNPMPVNKISYKSQSADLMALLQRTGVRPPIYIIGLSYGGGIALDFIHTYPGVAESAILMAPYTEPVRAQEKQISDLIRSTRSNPVLNYLYQHWTDDQLYDYFLKSIVATFPLAEPILYKEPAWLGWKLQAIFQMSAGIRHFEAKKIAYQLPTRSVHLMAAVKDEYIPHFVMNEFWDQVPLGSRASRLNILDGKHKIPEETPLFAAQWVMGILNKSIPANGATYNMNSSGASSIFLNSKGSKALFCSKTLSKKRVRNSKK